MTIVNEFEHSMAVDWIDFSCLLHKLTYAEP
jgi:hypothetical protein